MRVTLVGTGITLPSVGEAARRYNLANAYLEAFVRAHPVLSRSVEVRRLDLPISLDRPVFTRDALEEVLATRPDVLGLSCYAWDLEAQLALAAEVRRERPEVKIVLGGPSASVRDQELLEARSAPDVVVRGEGEATLSQALERGLDDLSGVPGLTWRDREGELHREPNRPPLADLGRIPSPLVTGVLEPPRQNLLLELGRGCRHRCAYCAWKLFGGGVRHHSEDRARQEIAWAVERGYEHAFIIDSALNDDDARLAGVARAAREADPDRRLAFSYFLSAEDLSPDQARHLAALRSHEVTLGLESVNPAALRAAGRKPLDPEAFARALDLLAPIAPATVSLMLGMPGDDLRGFRRTLDFVADLAERPGGSRVRAARVHWMMVAPGSTLWRRAGRYGLELSAVGIPYVLASETFPRGDLIEALRLLRRHPRSDLFIWEDAEPWRALQEPDGGPLYAPGGEHLGGRPGGAVTDEQVWRALRPLRPGRELAGGFVLAPLGRAGGFPVVRLRGPEGREVRLQLRPRGAEPQPLARTRSFDLVWLAPASDDDGERRLLRLLVELVRRNDGDQ